MSMSFWDRLTVGIDGLGVEGGPVAWDLAKSNLSDDDLQAFMDAAAPKEQ